MICANSLVFGLFPKFIGALVVGAGVDKLLQSMKMQGSNLSVILALKTQVKTVKSRTTLFILRFQNAWGLRFEGLFYALLSLCLVELTWHWNICNIRIIYQPEFEHLNGNVDYISYCSKCVSVKNFNMLGLTNKIRFTICRWFFLFIVLEVIYHYYIFSYVDDSYFNFGKKMKV